LKGIQDAAKGVALKHKQQLFAQGRRREKGSANGARMQSPGIVFIRQADGWVDHFGDQREQTSLQSQAAVQRLRVGNGAERQVLPMADE
jgi:hypothetical protein